MEKLKENNKTRTQEFHGKTSNWRKNYEQKKFNDVKN